MYGDMEEKFSPPLHQMELGFNSPVYTRLKTEEEMQDFIKESRQMVAKQHKMDSLIEAVLNTAVGFIISWAVWVWVVAPLFGFNNGAGTSFLVTCIFTVTSLLRQYFIRRLLDGKTIWEFIRAKYS